MGEDEVKSSHHPGTQIEIDLPHVHNLTRQGYEMLLAEFPTTLPWSTFVAKAAAIDSPTAPLFQSIRDNTHKMTEISALSWTTKRGMSAMGDSAALQEWRTAQIATIAGDLAGIGIPVTSDLLEGPLSDDPAYRAIRDTFFKQGKNPEEGLLEILFQVQREYASVAYATRIIHEMNVMIDAYAPDIPKLKSNVIGFTTNSRKKGYQENGGWLLLPGGKHVIVFVEPFGQVDSYLWKIKQPDLITTGEGADNFFVAAHETMGHGGFAELFDPIEAQELLGMEASRPDKTRLIETLNEGYAMLLEQLATEISYSDALGEDASWVDHGLAFIQKRRSESLVHDEYEGKGRVYSDGFTLMKTLMQQMVIYDHPSAQRILEVRAFLSTIDIRQAAEISPDDPRYAAVMADPYHLLPRKQKKLHKNP